LINLFVNDQMVSGNVFHQAGIWKLPVYNAAYYIAMIGSNVFNVIYIIILLRGKKNAESRELKEIFNELMAGVVVTAFFNLVIGTIDFRGWLPPYPYIYGTLIWCILLRRTMLRYDFLNHLDRRYEKLFNMNPLAILLFDLKGNLREANPVAIQLFASMALEPQQFFAELPEEMKARIASRHKIAPTERVILSEAGAFEVLIDCDYVVVEHIPHVIMIIRDVTQEKQNQREIAFLAYHDALTGLPNRRFYMEKLHEAIRRADRLRQPLAVAIFDVDHFKSINDKYGHLAGDQALVHIADKLREVIAPDGIVARLGGDEFSFFLADRPVEEVIEKIRQLLRALRQDPLSLPNANIPLCISIGVSLYPEHGQDSDTMLSNADKALYRVKRHTRNGYAVYSASDD